MLLCLHKLYILCTSLNLLDGKNFNMRSQRLLTQHHTKLFLSCCVYSIVIFIFTLVYLNRCKHTHCMNSLSAVRLRKY